ncbi:hypothetical protein [Specibacter cremeus]|uniref:hypothetical protein n=1 Tax=Specibacter cremeus TaxID=1629051 RepID=UPI000F768139|nr:hypothetical protein [Specibacter cremeus]
MEMMTITELEGESVELLPTKETLFFNFGHNWAAVWASNSSLAVNAGTILSSANSAALQSVNVVQSNS